jgi:sterol desaturase/sphingolipid hydroxylase (fatty acid hydroxylase superfamily)
MSATETPTQKPQNQGSQRLFENPVLEAMSKTHISLPLIIFGVVSGGLLYHGLTATDVASWTFALLFGVGFLTFTWIEYMAHRHIYHMEPDTKWKAEIQYKFHGVHHDFPKDKSRLALPPLVSLVVAGVLFLAFRLVMGDFVFGFLPGLLTGYASYLSVHYIVHAYRPPKNIFKALWVNHGIHHYKQSDKAFGVSSPLWDYIYGTMPEQK